MVELLEQYSNINNPKCDPEIKSGKKNFKGNYEPQPFRNPIEWEILAKRLQFLIRVISENGNQSIALLKEADEMEATLDFNGYPNRVEMRKSLTSQFLDMLISDGHGETAKRLKSNPLERIYWEVVRPSTLGEIMKKVQSK
jgi:hypothetical protein